MNGKMKKCKTCGNEIATTAKTCPSCGAKNQNIKPLAIAIIAFVLFSVIIGAVSSSDSGENTDVNKNGVVSESDKYVETETNCYSGDCGISASAEMGNSIINYPELNISISNISDKDIAAVQFYAVPCDVYGEEIKGWTRQDKLYTDTTIPAGKSTSINYQFIEDSVKTVKLYVYSVYFSDGTEWGNRNATTSEIVKYGKIIEVFGES